MAENAIAPARPPRVDPAPPSRVDPVPPPRVDSAPAAHVDPAPPPRADHALPRSLKTIWRKVGTPVLVLLLAAAVVLTITRNWNAWQGARVEQVTNDAFVRGDLTPLSTKVAGLVREVKVSDYQTVHKGDELVQLEDADYRAQIAQAEAAVEAAKAALENNRRQRELQDSRIQRAAAGIDQAKAQIAAATAGKEAVQADVTRTRAERARQEALLKTNAATQQKLEAAVADEAALRGAGRQSRRRPGAGADAAPQQRNRRLKPSAARRPCWSRRSGSCRPRCRPGKRHSPRRPSTGTTPASSRQPTARLASGRCGPVNSSPPAHKCSRSWEARAGCRRIFSKRS